jgi:hypothetical protein
MCSKSLSQRKEPLRASKLEISNSIQTSYNAKLPNKSPTFAELSWKKSMDFEKYTSRIRNPNSSDWSSKQPLRPRSDNDFLEDSMDLNVHVERKLADAFSREDMPCKRSPQKELNKENSIKSISEKIKDKSCLYLYRI